MFNSSSNGFFLSQLMSLEGYEPVTVESLPEEQVQVDGVIQTAQACVTHPHVQNLSPFLESEEPQASSGSIGCSQNVPEMEAQCPSYGNYLKDLSSEDTQGREGGTENPGVPDFSSMSVPTPICELSNGQYIAIASNGISDVASPDTDTVLEFQTLTMAELESIQQNEILQGVQTSDDQQILVPSNQVVVHTAAEDMQTYEIHTTPSATSLPQTVVIMSPVTLPSQTANTDSPQLKREVRLMKNREAAREYRRKKKEYVKSLENRVAILENENKGLIEEINTFKALHSHKSV